MRKSKILTFLFALFPGAGQMYLGYMKRGVSLMTAFFLVFALMGFLGMSFLAFFLPVIWFYAFFDTLNLRSMSYEYLPHDDFLFHLDSSLGNQCSQLLPAQTPSQRHFADCCGALHLASHLCASVPLLDARYRPVPAL